MPSSLCTPSLFLSQCQLILSNPFGELKLRVKGQLPLNLSIRPGPHLMLRATLGVIRAERAIPMSQISETDIPSDEKTHPSHTG